MGTRLCVGFSFLLCKRALASSIRVPDADFEMTDEKSSDGSSARPPPVPDEKSSESDGDSDLDNKILYCHPYMPRLLKIKNSVPRIPNDFCGVYTYVPQNICRFEFHCKDYMDGKKANQTILVLKIYNDKSYRWKI